MDALEHWREEGESGEHPCACWWLKGVAFVIDSGRFGVVGYIKYGGWRWW
jgi:hypothetical protein